MNRKTEILLENIARVIKGIIMAIFAIPLLFLLLMVILIVYGAIGSFFK